VRLGGATDLLVDAAIAGTNNIEDMSIDEWDRTMAIHLRSVFLANRLVLPIMYSPALCQEADIARSARCLTNKRHDDFHALAKMPILRFGVSCQFRDSSI
jgi:NAD(P)-dependent dehydrogenase (short-subunit alcohol dehydrogenase family)